MISKAILTGMLCLILSFLAATMICFCIMANDNKLFRMYREWIINRMHLHVSTVILQLLITILIFMCMLFALLPHK